MLDGVTTQTNEDLQKIVDTLRTFVKERDWAQFHDPKNLSMALSSEVGELTAIFRWVPNYDSDAFANDKNNRLRIELEVADIAICLFLLADRMGMDLLSLVEKKISLNGDKYPVETSRGKAERP